MCQLQSFGYGLAPKHSSRWPASGRQYSFGDAQPQLRIRRATGGLSGAGAGGAATCVRRNHRRASISVAHCAVCISKPSGAMPVGYCALQICLGFELTVLLFFPLIRHRVAEAGQEMSASTDETTSHSTKLANDASQVAGYV